MTPLQKIGLVMMLASALALGGCKKKPVTPTMTRLPQAPPPVAQQPPPEPAETEPLPAQAEEDEQPLQPDATTPANAKPRPPRRPAARTTPAESTPPANRTVVEEGGTPAEPPPAISTRMSQDQATNTRQQTASLLDQAEANLKRIDRELSEQEKAMVQQIRTYVSESRAATAANDLVRAQTLALKAHLLSQELVK